VGDLAGFVASAYRRGVPYVQIPTTLLAQVDSAIGGKVAIDIKEAKNIVGNFYQPKMVLCDLAFLSSLPEKELRNGLVEAVKYGIIKDKSLFHFLEKNLKKLLKAESGPMEHVVYKSCRIKARVVEKDEFDSQDIRAALNFGHTIGHAIEAALSYSKSLKHGTAVGLGMLMASDIALKYGMIKKREFKKIYTLIKKVSRKTSIKNVRTKRILEALSYDKKFVAGKNRFVVPVKIGAVKIIEEVPQRLIKEIVEKNA